MAGAASPLPAQWQQLPNPPADKAPKLHRPGYVRKSLVDVSNARRVNVAQLEEALRESKGHSDKEVARELSGLGLTERFSLSRLHEWEPRLPGKRSREALTLLADASAFLPLPDTDVLAVPRPSLADQRQMVARAIDYLAKDLRSLPNFLATRITERYEETDPEKQRDASGPTWHYLATRKASVLYRDGKEVVNPQQGGQGAPRGAAWMDVQGTFGPILVTVFKDAAHGRITWLHWEQGSQGPVPVFRYQVQKSESHYEVSYETLTGDLRHRIVHATTAYHGEVSIDPVSGAILRVTLEADLDPSLPFKRSDIAVDYATTRIGGKDYICPVHSVAISRGWTLALDEWGQVAGYGEEISTLNDVTFSAYHVFRSNSRILTGNSPAPGP